MKSICYLRTSSWLKLFSYLILVILLSACQAKKSKPSKISVNKAGITQAPGKTGVYSTPAQKETKKDKNGNPIKVDIVPEFSCCENGIVVTKKPGKIKSVINSTGKQTTLKLVFKINMEFQCDQLEEKKCSGTFLSITPKEHPKIIIMKQPDLNKVKPPTATKIWWNEAVEDCDGKHYKTSITVVYIATYEGMGIPFLNAGSERTKLILEFSVPEEKGTSYKGEFSIFAKNVKVTKPTVNLLSWTKI